MTISTFEISELSDESENDWCVEITTKDSKHGILLKDAEMRMIGDGIERAVDDDNPELLDNVHASDFEQSDNTGEAAHD